MIEELPKQYLFDVALTNSSAIDVLEYIVSKIEKSHDHFFIVTPNPEIIVYSSKHKDFRKILNQARISLCDGTGLFLAARFLGKPIKERITGIEMVYKLCEAVAEKPITVGFLGGRSGVAEMTADRLQKKYPGLKVGFVGEEWSEAGLRGKGKGERVRQQKKDHKLHPSPFTLHASIDILFVAFGFPKQEEWMAENINKLPVRVMIGVGGSFDEISGKVRSCPRWIDAIGMKWLWRLIIEPWRWKRQLALPQFIGMVIKEKFKLDKSSKL